MENKNPKHQIRTDLNEVQKEIEKAAENRKDEIKQDMKKASKDPQQKASKMTAKKIDADSQNIKNQMGVEAEERIESIDRMFDDSPETVDAHNKRSLRNTSAESRSDRLITGNANPTVSDSRAGGMESMGSNCPDYEVRDIIITDDTSDGFLIIHEERDLHTEER